MGGSAHRRYPSGLRRARPATGFTEATSLPSDLAFRGAVGYGTRVAVFQSVLAVIRARQYPLNQSLDDASSSIIARQKRNDSPTAALGTRSFSPWAKLSLGLMKIPVKL